MSVQVSYPGVYISEVSSGVQTITGVATSIAAFFGRTAKGPINKAVRCLSPHDFTREFGGPHPSSDLAQSVRQFFDNGGTDCYVVRLAHKPEQADITLKNITAENVLKATAKDPGKWGNGIRLEVDYATSNPDETFNLRVKYEDRGTVVEFEEFINLSMDPNSPRYAPPFVTQSSRIIDLDLDPGDAPPATIFDIESSPVDGYSESRRPFKTSNGGNFHTALNGLMDTTGHFEISVNDEQYVPIDLSGVIISHTSPGVFIDEAASAIQNEINTQLDSVITGLSVKCSWELVHGNFHVLRITSDTEPKLSVRIRRSSTNDLAGSLMLGLDQGGIEETRYSNHRPVPTATVLTGDINELASLTHGAFNQLIISGSSVDLGTDLETSDPSDPPNDRWYSDGFPTSVNGNNDGVREKLNIIAKAINDAPNLPCKAKIWGYQLALIPTGDSINNTIDITSSGGTGTDIGTVGLDLFTPNVRQYALGATGTSNFQDGAGKIGKDDDGNPPDEGDYLGSEADQTGFHALDSVDLFNLMVLPGDEEIGDTHLQLWGPASIYCLQNRAFLLMDAPDSWTNEDRPVATNVEVNNLRALVENDYSAVFYPKALYSDRGIKKFIGPSGMIAGLISRTDSTRGVWKAPAGTEANLRGILDLQVNLTDRENGVLNKLGVNCLRKFPSGIVNWGARTMDGFDGKGSEWKYIPIRRLALFIEESLYRGTKWVVFEPNDEPLWAKIRMNLGAFMMSLFRQGAFQGSTPDRAYFVKCDAETTTQNDRNLGIVNIEVGFAPLKPAEFVVIKIQQIASEL